MDPELLARLIALYPEGERRKLRSHDFEFDGLDEDDPRLRAILSLLEAHGYRPDLRMGTPPEKRFLVDIKRTYDASDMEGCELAEIGDFLPGFGAFLQNPPSPEGTPRTGPLVLTDLVAIRYDENGEEVEDEDQEGGGATDWGAADVSAMPVGAAVGGNWLVWDRVRRGIEGAGFTHVVLTPTVLTGEAARKAPEPIWEVTTGLLTPPLSPSLLRVDRQGSVVDRREATVAEVTFREGLTFPQALYPIALRYARADLEALGPFDLAALRERAHDYPPGFLPRPQIASARFYRFCVEHGMPFTWRPVHVDEGI